MLFSSIEFIFLFLPIVFILYFVAGKHRKSWAMPILVLASLFFYGYWKPIYLPLIITSTLVNFYLGRLIAPKRGVNNKKILVIGVMLNAGFLVIFKYTDFILENTNLIFNTNYPMLGIILPLAISFFTFQQIAYLVDRYNGIAGNYTLLEYFLFVTFFPQLIAGPIVHHKEMMPQFKALKNANINYTNIEKGIAIFSIGLFKKLIIADYFGGFADKGYAEVSSLNFWGAWSTSLSYTIQLYYDFSGYCDMAIGAALLFNIKLPINFNSPYKAISIQDFWRRWHITLSTWLRDYIYIPLGGNRNGNFKTYRNLFITFVLGGIWHGAGWGFFIWGVLHGLGLMLHRVWQKYDIAMPNFIAWLITMLYVHLTWVFFRADNLADANIIIIKLFSLSDIFKTNISQNLFVNYHLIGSVEGINGPYIALLGLFLFVISATTKNTIELMQASMIEKKRTAFLAALSLSAGILALLGNSSQTFLYFNF